MSTILVSGSCDIIASTKPRMLASKSASGTYSLSPIRQASFAPRKMVMRRVRGADGAVMRVSRLAKEGLMIWDV